MAVAVKTSPEARSESTMKSPDNLSLFGVGYLIVCLAIVFKILPTIWWWLFEAAGLPRSFSFEGGVLLVLLCMAAGIAGLIYGRKNLGPEPTPGVLGGVFLGFLALLVVLLLARWASLWFEHWATNGTFTEMTGMLLAATVLVVLLGGAIWALRQPRALKFAISLEDAGWFSTKAHKPNQGRVVRRATIIGILLLVIAGIWTLISHGTLRRMPDDLVLDIPFSGHVALTNMGDMRPFVGSVFPKETFDVEILTPGGTSYSAKEHVSTNDYIDKVKEITQKNRQISLNVDEKTDKDVTVWLNAVNQALIGRMRALLALKESARLVESASAIKRLTDAYNSADRDIAGAVQVFEREASQFKRTEELGPEFKLPTAVMLMDVAQLRKLNAEADEKKNVRVGQVVPPKSSGWTLDGGAITTAAEFDKAIVQYYSTEAGNKLIILLRGSARDRTIAVLKDLETATNGESFKDKLRTARESETEPLQGSLKSLESDINNLPLPNREALTPAWGKQHYASIPLLPAVRYTLPLLLLTGAIWIAWRIVNLPVFADFLIATEAEMNKVSWSTQKKLVQDTIVVLATVILMAVFLFGMDWLWKEILSFKSIGVLHIPAQKEDEKVEQKQW